ncbi:MAG: glycerol kinase GlpK, partial [Burkholderiales bacterium]
MKYLLALDQGTSSSRSILFDEHGNIIAMAQRELTQIYPQPGWVEHNPMEIWLDQLATAREAIAKAGIPALNISAIGITNQRETTVVWNRKTGVPIYNAIVWQDRRGEPACADLRAKDLEASVRKNTGLTIDAYFSGTKLKWIFDNVAGARDSARRGELAFGTIDTWLAWQLSRGQLHVTDVSNASRTMLFNIRDGRWDDELLAALNIPHEVLPQVHSSSHHFGNTAAEFFGANIPICGLAGDQQAALFGQTCFHAGLAKNTYGTGCFMLKHTGNQFIASRNGLITTAAAQPTNKAEYALEGSVFIGGAVVQWLRDGLKAISTSSAVESLAESVPDCGGVRFVPAFTGLGAPYWQPNAKGAIVGLTRGSTVAHIARAALESIAYQSAALLLAMIKDSGPVNELRVDGGACVNNMLMQFQADLLGIPVVRPKVIETTALGAAYLAGLATGVYRDLDQLSAHWQVERIFHPTMSRQRAEELMANWEHAVA